MTSVSSFVVGNLDKVTSEAPSTQNFVILFAEVVSKPTFNFPSLA